MQSFRTVRSVLFLAALAAGLSACASGGGGGGAPRGSTNRIIESELEALVSLDAFEAVQRLRPRWLTPRAGSVPQVVVDGTQQGGPEALRRFRVSDVQELRYLSAGDATMRYGTGFPGGAIEVVTRR
ncbi:MAG: hypothetical protein OEZ65_12405 [Gemmatimonadota bacterium]|nr:hypothetical protein [Gemmatimonadota bacterium]MDH5760382.1 hypothetical protein [Gemmatimonadota bacterium]